MNMRTKTIAAMVAAGVSADKADKYWAVVREKLCDHEEPTEQGLTLLRDEQIRAVLPALGAEAFISAIRTPAIPKAKKFRTGKVYSPEEYVAFYVADPRTPGLVEQITSATDGKPWLVAKAGKVYETQSAQYIRWHIAEDPAPIVVDVDGEPIAPAMPGEEREARLYYVDPFDQKNFLDVNRCSTRTGASFVGYNDESLSAMSFLFLREMLSEGNISLRKIATDNRGKAPCEILAPFPMTLAIWNRLRPEDRPAAKRAKEGAPRPPFADISRLGPRQETGSLPLLYVVGASSMRARWRWFSDHMAPLRRVARVVSDDDGPPGSDINQWVAKNMRDAAMFVVLLDATTLMSDAVHLVVSDRSGRPVLPIIMGHCDYPNGPLAHLEAAPARGKGPMGTDDAKAVDVVTMIRRVLTRVIS